jgi:hypothetical protein
MFSDFICPEDPRWARVLERVPHDVYHLPQYTSMAAKHEGGEPIAFYSESKRREMLIPVLLKETPVELGAPREWKDITSPYGYPGPLATHPDDIQWLGESLASFRHLGSRNGIITAFLRLHPLRGVPDKAFANHGTVVYHGPVVYVDLGKTVDELNTETRENHRRNVKRLKKAGFSTAIDDWSLYAVFGSLYRTTMERVAADRFYFFSDTYFRAFRDMLAGHVHLCAVLAPNGEVASAGLFTETDGIVEYHLGATAASYVKDAASKLMFDAITRWAKGAAFTLLNLGGGIGGHSGPLLNFKAGFSRSQAPFHTLRMVFDDARYGHLNSLWRARSDFLEGAGDYFPMYRQPLKCGTPPKVI